MNTLSDILAHHMTIPTSWMWATFGVIVIAVLYLDLFVFHRHSDEPKLSTTILQCLFYFSLAVLFGIFVIYEKGIEDGLLFFTGYMVEESLSLDNIFVISVIFSSLNIPRRYQHRVLFWGILGALILRACAILAGEALVSNFHWVLYIFSAFLIYTGIHMIIEKNDDTRFEDGKIYKFVSKYCHVTPQIEGERFFVKHGNKHYITPLFFALIIIELMDVIFALDSIPAIFLITTDVFIVYTSNIFAILGLRALYFLLAEMVHRFAYLKYALSIILIFIGSKIFIPHIFGVTISSTISLIITFCLIAGGIITSLIRTRKSL